MKAFRSVSSLAAGLSIVALAIAPAAPQTALAAQQNMSDIDLAIARAAKTVVAPAQTPAPANSGEGEADAAADDVKCLVKFWEPTAIGGALLEFDTIAHIQAKLICNDTVGDAELLIEQNDQIVVAQTLTNDQTEVSMFSATVKLTDEQEDTFCVSIAREAGDGFDVVAQECWHDLGDSGLYNP